MQRMPGQLEQLAVPKKAPSGALNVVNSSWYRVQPASMLVNAQAMRE